MACSIYNWLDGINYDKKGCLNVTLQTATSCFIIIVSSVLATVTNTVSMLFICVTLVGAGMLLLITPFAFSVTYFGIYFSACILPVTILYMVPSTILVLLWSLDILTFPIFIVSGWIIGCCIISLCLSGILSNDNRIIDYIYYVKLLIIGLAFLLFTFHLQETLTLVIPSRTVLISSNVSLQKLGIILFTLIMVVSVAFVLCLVFMEINSHAILYVFSLDLVFNIVLSIVFVFLPDLSVTQNKLPVLVCLWAIVFVTLLISLVFGIRYLKIRHVTGYIDAEFDPTNIERPYPVNWDSMYNDSNTRSHDSIDRSSSNSDASGNSEAANILPDSNVYDTHF